MKDLVTDRLVLRCFAEPDAEFILELLNEAPFHRWIGDKQVRTLENARGYLRTGPLASYAEFGFGLCAVRKTDGTPIGMCGLLKRDTLPEPDIGFAFLERYCGQGYGFESASAVLAHARDELRIPRILAITHSENAHSIGLLEKLGLSFTRTVSLGEDGAESRLYAIDFPQPVQRTRLL